VWGRGRYVPHGALLQVRASARGMEGRRAACACGCAPFGALARSLARPRSLTPLSPSRLSTPNSQGGLCELTPTACDGTCQLHYSGPGSPCSANLPPPLASVVWAGDEKLGLGPKVTGALPPVPPGAVCGEYVGACPAAQCCSQFGFCVEDASYFCSTAACVLAASPASPSCMAAWAARTPITRKLKLVASWGRAAPDGVEREVILLNGKFPGPTVRGTVRDRVQVRESGERRGRGDGGRWRETPGRVHSCVPSSLHLSPFPHTHHTDRVRQPAERGA